MKLGRYEAFLNLAREVGEDSFSWTRGERALTGEAGYVARERDTGDKLSLRGRRIRQYWPTCTMAASDQDGDNAPVAFSSRTG